MLDPRQLEEKLEKDNLTLKEQISKLQSTIKQIKSEITGGKSQDTKHDSKEDNYLKFSFNSNNYKQENISNPSNFSSTIGKSHRGKETSPKKENPQINNNSSNYNTDIKLKKNIYSDNLEKIRKEKQIINEMEEFKKRANLKKTFSDEEVDGATELEKFHKNYKNERKLEKVRPIEIDELKDSIGDNKKWQGEVENDPNNNNPNKSNFYDDAPNFQKAKHKTGQKFESINDKNKNNNYSQGFEESEAISKTNFEKNAYTYNENIRSIKTHQDNNLYKSDSDQEEDSFEMKIKSIETNNSKIGNLEKEKSKKLYKGKNNSNLSNLSNSPNYNSNKVIQKSNKVKLKDSPKNKPKKIEVGNNTSFNNNKSSSKCRVSIAKPAESRPKSSKRNVASQKGIQANPAIGKKEKSNSDSLNSTKKFEDLSIEVTQLKKEIERLKSENLGLKNSLEQEKIQSNKIKNFAEEILKFYNK